MVDKRSRISRRSLYDFLIFVLVMVGVFCLWCGMQWYVDRHITGNGPGKESDALMRGLYGEKFGGTSALFSGLAFAGIILTILLQRRDLSETRRTTNYQRFDNTFFQLLNLHIDITEKLSMLQQNGRESCAAFNENLKQSDPDFVIFAVLQKLETEQIRTIMDKGLVESEDYRHLDKSEVANLNSALLNRRSSFDNYFDKNKKMHIQKIKNAYSKAASDYIDNFSHYFRHLYHILKFVSNSTLIDVQEKREYAKYVRSQLSDAELVAIFYNCILPIDLPGRDNMELGYPKMHALINQFDILQNMSPRSIFNPIHQEIFAEDKIIKGS